MWTEEHNADKYLMQLRGPNEFEGRGYACRARDRAGLICGTSAQIYYLFTPSSDRVHSFHSNSQPDQRAHPRRLGSADLRRDQERRGRRRDLSA